MVITTRTETTKRATKTIYTMSCDACSKVFERKDPPLEKHYCSITCYRTAGKGSRGGTIKEVSCSWCKATFTRQIFPSKGDQKMFFCDEDCMFIWREANGEEWGKNYAFMNTPEAKTKAKASMEIVRSSPDYVHPWEGRHHTEETKQKIAKSHEESPRTGDKNGMFGRNHSTESREKMSETRTDRIISGEIKIGYTRHERGEFIDKLNRTYSYKSSWELAMMKWLDVSETIESWQYEPCKIIYWDSNGDKRRYIPDFLVKFKNERSSRMYEIKPKEFLYGQSILLKSEAAKQYCSQNNIVEYKILTKDELVEMGVL